MYSFSFDFWYIPARIPVNKIVGSGSDRTETKF